MIALPDDDTFGFLVLVSYAFYFVAFLLFVDFVVRTWRKLGDDLEFKVHEESENSTSVTTKSTTKDYQTFENETCSSD